MTQGIGLSANDNQMAIIEENISLYSNVSKCAFVGIDIDGGFVNGNFESVFVDFSRSPDFDICLLEFFTVEDISAFGVTPRSGQRVVLADCRRLSLNQCLKSRFFFSRPG